MGVVVKVIKFILCFKLKVAENDIFHKFIARICNTSI